MLVARQCIAQRRFGLRQVAGGQTGQCPLIEGFRLFGCRDTRPIEQFARARQHALVPCESAGQPREFVLDATKQYALTEYDSHLARMISMYANRLPPLGFIGTTAGLLVLFVSMRLDNDSLELGALALALLSSIAALIGFAVLEALKIRLYGRALACVDDVLAQLP